MTQPEHPPVEQISDLLAGALPAAEAMDVNAHLASCEACSGERTALTALTALLAGEGTAPIQMPADVADSLDAALRRAGSDRASTAAVPDLDTAHPRTRRLASARQPLKWLGGAAAAVAVLGLGLAGLEALPHDNTGDGADGASGGYVQDSGQFSGHGPVGSGPSASPHSGSPVVPQGGGNESAPGRVPTIAKKADVASAAFQLASAPARAVRPHAAGCAVPLSGDVPSVVRFEGREAVLTITRDTRLATIYDCATATKTLFITEY